MVTMRGLDDLYDHVIGEGLCAACGACVGGCPYLTAFRGRTIMLDHCTVQQGRCFTYCPMTFFDEELATKTFFGQEPAESPLGHTSRVVASRAKAPELAEAGQGGGTVTSLVLEALERGAVDSAILSGPGSDGRMPAGFIALTPEDVKSAAGSRYVGSHSLAALREALDRGYERIGVIGLPCQVRSVRKMQMYDLKDENLRQRIPLVIGLFCNWAFSAREFIELLNDRVSAGKIKRFDIPPPPADIIKIVTSLGQQSIPLEEVRPFIQAACHRCTDLTSEFADVSVGMYEGRDGWNTCIVRTHAGSDLVDESIAADALEIDEFPQSNLDHLSTASARKKERAAQAT